MNPEWQQIADNVVKGAKILIKRGICEAFGHLSARLPGSDRFIITPSLSMAMVRSTDDLVQVNLKGRRWKAETDSLMKRGSTPAFTGQGLTWGNCANPFLHHIRLQRGRRARQACA